MPLAIFNSLSFCNSDCDLDVDCGEGFVSTGQDSTLSQDVMVWGLKTPIIVLTHNKEQEQCYNSDDCGLFSHKETNFLTYEPCYYISWTITQLEDMFCSLIVRSKPYYFGQT